MNGNTFDAVVVGGGIAGLYAANLLRRRGIREICIAEANDVLGGRISHIDGLVPWPLEVGPEFLHGDRSLLVDVCREVGMNFREVAWPDRVYWGDTRQLASAGEQSASEFEELDSLMFEELRKQDMPAEDISVRQWMHQKGASPRLQALADACYSNDFACSLDELGLTEAIIECRKWDSGESYLLKDRPLRQLVTHLAAGIYTRASWPVCHIEWVQGRGARVHSSNGESLACRAVICAVPITQLQNDSIRFSPPIPPEQKAAIHRIRMGSAVKVFGVFNRRFWPEDTWDVVCVERPFPEVWMTCYDSEDDGHVTRGEVHCVTAFCTGEYACKIGAMSPAAAVESLKEQLDEMFGNTEQPKPASVSFVRGYVKDWSKVPFIQGAYTHPSLGARVGDRGLAAASLGNVVFFAGEHTHLDMNPCLQGALETGDRAAAQVYHALRKAKTVSKL